MLQHHDALLARTVRSVRLFDTESPLPLDLGGTLAPVDVAFETYGTLNSDATNAVLICHALTGSAFAAGGPDAQGQSGWWTGLIGPGKTIDTREFFVISPNIRGSCYGTTGPSSVDPDTGSPYGPRFPSITIRDIVHVQHALVRHLGVRRLRTVIGSSLGGMQVLEWGAIYPDLCDTLIPVSAAAAQPAWCIGLNAIARAAMTSDPAWNNGNYEDQPQRGLALARMVGMMSYRTPEEYEQRFGRSPSDAPSFDYAVESYLHYQGAKLVGRFDANTYLTLSKATDGHDIARGRGSAEAVLGGITVPTLSIGFSSDQRYHPVHQKFVAESLPNGRYVEIESIHGHDGFLIDFQQLDAVIRPFLASVEERRMSA